MRRLYVETLVFWLGVIAFFVFFEVTTERERRKWFYDFLTAVALLGATGFVWEQLTGRL